MCCYWIRRRCLMLCRQQAAAEGWSLKDIATQAYNDRVDLSAHGFFATPEVTGGLLNHIA
jgi:xanthine dehydrogenase molybdopterin-binding subunit B